MEAIKNSEINKKQPGELINEIKTLINDRQLIISDMEQPFFGEITILIQSGKLACIKKLETIK